MNDQVTISPEELDALRHRVAIVARSNAWLRVLTSMLALRELDPGVTAVVSSGYSSDATVADCKAFGFAGALMKPYNLDEIGRVLAGLRV